MVERVDGINQMQNTERINSVSNRETDRNKKNNNRDLLESVKENKLSSDKLKKELEEKIDDMNSIMETLEEKLSFKLHDDTDRIMTQIIDIKTEEVIKEMPPEEMLDLAAKIHEMVGLILDEKV
jgi:flagellar protein FlaG